MRDNFESNVSAEEKNSLEHGEKQEHSKDNSDQDEGKQHGYSRSQEQTSSSMFNSNHSEYETDDIQDFQAQETELEQVISMRKNKTHEKGLNFCRNI